MFARHNLQKICLVSTASTSCPWQPAFLNPMQQLLTLTRAALAQIVFQISTEYYHFRNLCKYASLPFLTGLLKNLWSKYLIQLLLNSKKSQNLTVASSLVRVCILVCAKVLWVSEDSHQCTAGSPQCSLPRRPSWHWAKVSWPSNLSSGTLVGGVSYREELEEHPVMHRGLKLFLVRSLNSRLTSTATETVTLWAYLSTLL